MSMPPFEDNMLARFQKQKKKKQEGNKRQDDSLALGLETRAELGFNRKSELSGRLEYIRSKRWIWKTNSSICFMIFILLP